MKGLDQFPVFRLRHGLWTPLSEVIETVKAWPGMLNRFSEKGFKLAVEEFNDSPRRKRLEAEQEKNRLLQTVIVPYLGSVLETFLYARARMMDAFGTDYDEWEEAFAQDVDDKRIQLLPEVADRKECLRIEVVDFGAHFNHRDGFLPQDVRDKNSAHAAVIYATSQNTTWVRQMDGVSIPFVLAGGYKLNVPGCREWAFLPYVWRFGVHTKLYGGWCYYRCCDRALPVLWE